MTTVGSLGERPPGGSFDLQGARPPVSEMLQTTHASRIAVLRVTGLHPPKVSKPVLLMAVAGRKARSTATTAFSLAARHSSAPVPVFEALDPRIKATIRSVRRGHTPPI